MRAAYAMPAHLAKIGYKNPIDGTNTPLLSTTDANAGTNVFQWLGTQPKISRDFNIFMTDHAANRPTWLELYPAERLLPAKPGSGQPTTVVDVGGGLGHDLEKFRAAFPGKTGRLVVQDQPMAIEAATVTPPVEKQVYDFFTSQPIKGMNTLSVLSRRC